MKRDTGLFVRERQSVKRSTVDTVTISWVRSRLVRIYAVNVVRRQPASTTQSPTLWCRYRGNLDVRSRTQSTQLPRGPTARLQGRSGPSDLRSRTVAIHASLHIGLYVLQ